MHGTLFFLAGSFNVVFIVASPKKAKGISVNVKKYFRKIIKVVCFFVLVVFVKFHCVVVKVCHKAKQCSTVVKVFVF